MLKTVGDVVQAQLKPLYSRIAELRVNTWNQQDLLQRMDDLEEKQDNRIAFLETQVQFGQPPSALQAIPEAAGPTDTSSSEEEIDDSGTTQEITSPSLPVSGGDVNIADLVASLRLNPAAEGIPQVPRGQAVAPPMVVKTAVEPLPPQPMV